MKKASSREREQPQTNPRMFLIPCSCGTTFAVSEEYDRKGMHLRSFIPCPNCGKRHDPRNRLLHLGCYQQRFWNVEDC